MTVAQGRDFLSIPGPTVVPDQVLSAMHRPAVDIYSGPLVDVTDDCLENLKKVFQTAAQVYIYAANGHGAWEAALSNTLSKGDTLLVLESGVFARTWGESGTVQGLQVIGVASDSGHPANFQKAAEVLRDDTGHKIKAVLTVQVDTASGVVNDVSQLRGILDELNHPALLMVDCIGSLGTMPFKMDEWGVDVAITGSQKGLMLPPGLSFVAANDRARARHKTADLRTHYWDWTFRDGPEHYMKYCGTPPVQMMFGLQCSLNMILTEGLDAVFERHRLLATAVRAAIEAWGSKGLMQMNIPLPEARANSVTTIILAEGKDPQLLLNWCQQHAGVKLGITIGELHGKGFRIGHMGYVNAPMVLGTLAVVETALHALQWPMGSSGVAAATEILGKSLVEIST